MLVVIKNSSLSTFLNIITKYRLELLIIFIEKNY